MSASLPTPWLVIGGCRSGKSRRAETLAHNSGLPVNYVATYATNSGTDPEMARRIAIHQARRPKNWRTTENRFDLAEILREQSNEILLLDCLSLWVSWRLTGKDALPILVQEIRDFLTLAIASRKPVILVSSEAGQGMVPEHPASRLYRDALGLVNQTAAETAAVVEWMVAGIPVRIKGETP